MRPSRRAALRPHPVAVLVILVGLVITVVALVGAWRMNRTNEQRLIEQRVAEAGAVLQAAIPGLQAPLAAGAELAELTGATGDQAAFERLMGPLVARGAFASASVWRLDGSDLRPLVVVGAPPALQDRPAEEIRAFVERSAKSDVLSVIGLFGGDRPRLGYSFNSVRPEPQFMAYAELPLDQSGTSEIGQDDAFHGLDYAIYLGAQESTDSLLGASIADLPIDGRRASRTVAFGDSSLLLVMTPTGHQGGTLLAVLPWLLLIGGVALSLGAGGLVERIQRRGDEAERLAAENAELYRQQHRVAHTLQHSLLPERLPDVAGIELAVRYQPGVTGMEVGGDWYDALVLDDGRLVLVVGDVSGRGVRAASVTASMRYTGRAFASQGEGPASVLSKLNDLTDVDVAGHFATAVCVVFDPGAGTATAASAGHPRPLLIDGDRVDFVPTTPGQPIGLGRGATYESVTVALPAAGTLLLFTDGLFERRAEGIDVGLERLRRSVGDAGGDLSDLLDGVLTAMGCGDEGGDDVAILGARWGN